jgi:hypothetical protein
MREILDDVTGELRARGQPGPDRVFMESVLNGKDFSFVLRKGAT